MKLVIRTIILCESLMVYSVLVITVNADDYENCSMAYMRNLIKLSCEHHKSKRSLNYITDNENGGNPTLYKYRSLPQIPKNKIPPNVTITTKRIPLRRSRRNLPNDFVEIHTICCKEPKRCENLQCPPL